MSRAGDGHSGRTRDRDVIRSVARALLTRAARRLTVKIPPGVKDGQRIRLAGQGNPGANGGPPGDAYLRVRVKPHPFFTRDGDDLRVELPVAMHEAMLGGEVTVPTLKGRLALRIPPETQNGRTIRLAGQGMPRQAAAGDVTERSRSSERSSRKERSSHARSRRHGAGRTFGATCSRQGEAVPD